MLSSVLDYSDEHMQNEMLKGKQEVLPHYQGLI